MDDYDIDESIDLSGLNCPLPILKTKKKLSSMSSGERLLVVATDPGSYDDFQYFCSHSGHKLISREKKDALYNFLIERE